MNYTIEDHLLRIVALVSLLDGEVKQAGMFEKKRLPSGESGFVGRVLEALP